MSLVHRTTKRLRKSLHWLKGWLRVRVAVPVHAIARIPINNLSRYAWKMPFIERREYSQNGEDGIIEAIFAMIGTTNRWYVEFGVEDGMECNTRYLRIHRGWTGVLMDGGQENPSINLRKEFITADNIETLFAKHQVPALFDLLSIDIDGNDYWVWKAVTRYRPRVVIVEYNACIPYAPAVTIPYHSTFQWDKTDYYGASLSALVALGMQKGYTLVATDPCGVNAFFVHNDYVVGRFVLHAPETLYHPAAFKGKKGNRHPPDPSHRKWESLTTQ